MLWIQCLKFNPSQLKHEFLKSRWLTPCQECLLDPQFFSFRKNGGSRILSPVFFPSSFSASILQLQGTIHHPRAAVLRTGRHLDGRAPQLHLGVFASLQGGVGRKDHVDLMGFCLIGIEWKVMKMMKQMKNCWTAKIMMFWYFVVVEPKNGEVEQQKDFCWTRWDQRWRYGQHRTKLQQGSARGIVTQMGDGTFDRKILRLKLSFFGSNQ